MATGLEGIFEPPPVAQCEICGSSLDRGSKRALCSRCQAAFASYGRDE